MTSRSEPRLYPYPTNVVFDAAMAGLQAPNTTKLRINGADPSRGTVWVDRSASALSWGEKVTIYVYQADPASTGVVVDSALKFGLFGWGAHKRNHANVFAAIDQGLRLTGTGAQPPAAPLQYPQDQAPGPYPYQRPHEPPPGATRF